jgi:DNA-binding NtrC family response regulator
MKILVVDDEVKYADAMAERLNLRGYETVAVYDGSSGLETVDRESFDAMLLDLRLPDIDGIEVLEKTLEKHPDMRIIIISGHANEEEFARCRKKGAFACLQKPVNMPDVRKYLEMQENEEK